MAHKKAGGTAGGAGLRRGDLYAVVDRTINRLSGYRCARRQRAQNG